MVSTRDRLKQTKEKLVSPLAIHRKPNSKKKVNLEMGDSDDRLTTLETTVSDLTTTVGELVEQLRLTNLAKASALIKRQDRLRKKGVLEVDGNEGTAEIDNDFSDSEFVKERPGIGKSMNHMRNLRIDFTPLNSTSGSSHTPLDSTSGSSHSETLLEEADSTGDPAFYSGSATSLVHESIELGGSRTAMSHDIRLHEINTLEWEDLLMPNGTNDYSAFKRGDISSEGQLNQNEINASGSDGFLLSNDIPGKRYFLEDSGKLINSSPPTDTKLLPSGYFQNGNQTNSDVSGRDFEMVARHTDGSLETSQDCLQAQDSFGRWMNYIMTDIPVPLEELPVESSISILDESNTSIMMDNIQDPVFAITDISPAWAFSTEETKVIVIGYFHRAHSQLVESNLLCVFSDICASAEMIQDGVFRTKALPHSPGSVSFYLSFDGHTPISQVMTFEYRSPPMAHEVSSQEDKSKWEDFQVQVRLSRLLFSTTNSVNILSSKISPNALKEVKKFALATSFIGKDWAYLIKSIGGGEISFSQARSDLFEITLKNKLQEWLLAQIVEGCKSSVRDRQGQGIIHLCAILGYAWAVRPFSLSGLSLDFRDAAGWTALHWAAYYGREKMVAVLLSAGANPSLVTDPTAEFPGGCTAADLASKNGYDGLAAYLAEKGLTEHFRLMSLSGNISGSLQTGTTDLLNSNNLNEEQLCQKDTLAAYRRAADAASRIQEAFRENSLKLRSKAVQVANPEIEARNIVAAMKIQHAFRNYDTRKKMTAALHIQHRFRSWKIRKDFLNLRRHTIRIQAAFRGHQMRKHYHKILWSVGVLEKAVLRWRLKRKGFRGIQPEQNEAVEQNQDDNVEEDFFRISRRQAEERIERSVVRVQTLFRSYRAQQEYRRMKMTYDQALIEDVLESEVGIDM
ncbi:hypothetical protein GIB67_039724 [Kingdonia uniflora]|uniref:Uncharacterized protein n=1 Tax=Kingdonia uniflora TaxID=39325 RepID=A0A7J7MQ03_9MAGN|nr:hypothetical protein GIB67_039724 [Kingdonia uniflora]